MVSAVSDECIHGFEGRACDFCYPKAPPEPQPAAAARRKAAKRVVASATVKKRLVDVGEQRIYHITHIDNLPGILGDGHLLADASGSWAERQVVDISSPGNREVRRATTVAGEGSLSVAHYVPFFFAPNARMWEGIRAREADPRLSPDVATRSPYDFAILASSVKQAMIMVDVDEHRHAPSVAVTDGDAAAHLTRFGSARSACERAMRKLHSDEDSGAILEAEFLVKDMVPFEWITLIGVANNRARDAVKEILAPSMHRPKVAVYPPWFMRPETG